MAQQPGHKRGSGRPPVPRHPLIPPQSLSHSLSHSPSLTPPHSLSSLTLALLVLLLTASLCHTASGAPMSPDDSYLPACSGLLGDPPPGGWVRWSDPRTWAGEPVPGVGAQKGANVTIPCGKGILLDLPAVNLTVLNILGSLKFLDDPTLPRVSVYASFIIVEGRFIIGNPGAQFSQKAYIELIPNPNGRAEYHYTARAPADADNPRNLGHKAFAVVGGQVDIHGLPGPANLPVWVKLAATAGAGSSKLLVKGDVSGWQPYAPIVVAPTDFRYDQEDVSYISSVNCTGTAPGTCEILLARPLSWNHFGDPRGVPDGFGGYIEEAGEVALLTRNIVITGTDEPAPYDLEGGHFMVFFTNTPQLIEGVQFLKMGQQGMIGRYPIHFHLCGDQTRRSVVHSNLIIHSKQRCVVLHATFNATVSNNVAYNTSGHCYMTEEGSEEGNWFLYNLGLRTEKPRMKISDDESDDQPATFWIANSNNNYIGNSAGGSKDSGFWLELRYRVRGISATWAKVNTSIPIRNSKLGIFRDNTAHSNAAFGLRTYVNGYLPRLDAVVGMEFYGEPVWRELGGFNIWKCKEGANLHLLHYVVFSNTSLADNVRALFMHDNERLNVTGIRIVGQSSNYGNPYDCDSSYGIYSCAPITGCAFPLPPGIQGRSAGFGSNNHSLLGVVIDQSRQNSPGPGIPGGVSIQVLQNTTFSGFDNTCRIAAAVGVGTFRENYWHCGHGVEGLRFSNSTKTNRLYLFPPHSIDGVGHRYDDGESAKFYALRDYDGSLLGSGPGYAVADNQNILPNILPGSKNSLPGNQSIYSGNASAPGCTYVNGWNGYSCPGTCYRTVEIMYDEPEFKAYPIDLYGPYPTFPPGDRVLGNYSYINVTWVKDGRTFAVEGNLRQYRNAKDGGIQGPFPDSFRIFPMSLLANTTYKITLVPPTNNPLFVPQNLQVGFKDGPGCGQGLTLRFQGAPSGQYSWALHPDTAIQLGGGVSSGGTLNRIAMPVVNASTPIAYRVVCNETADSTVAGKQNTTASGVQQLEIEMRPSLPSPTLLTLVPVAPPGMCGSGGSSGVAVLSGAPAASTVPVASHGHKAMGGSMWALIFGLVLPFVMLL